jgi:F420H(2)-dependent quinone reductase
MQMNLPDERPEGLDSPWVPKFLKVMSRANVALYRATGGRLGGKWRVGAAFPKGIPICLLTTIGRKTGQPRTLPLVFLEDGDKVILVASQGGLPTDPLWYKNLKANPVVSIQIGKEERSYNARTADPEERAYYWPKLVAHYADFAKYERWTERTIPVVICELVG